ncbi:uncharacterized protein [Miscanthus floridulus]|uniref:uncharacterized protein isoform X2 n=1 Tax=Miscanthus floridulus TaxID=154761 RepID=UPI003458B2D3
MAARRGRPGACGAVRRHRLHGGARGPRRLPPARVPPRRGFHLPACVCSCSQRNPMHLCSALAARHLFLDRGGGGGSARRRGDAVIVREMVDARGTVYRVGGPSGVRPRLRTLPFTVSCPPLPPLLHPCCGIRFTVGPGECAPKRFASILIGGLIVRSTYGDKKAICIFCKDTELKITLWGAEGKDFSVDGVYRPTKSTIVILFVGCLQTKIYTLSQNPVILPSNIESHTVRNLAFPINMQAYPCSEAPTLRADDSPPESPGSDESYDTAVQQGVDTELLEEAYWEVHRANKELHCPTYGAHSNYAQDSDSSSSSGLLPYT